MLAINYWFKFVVILLVIIFFGQSESSQFEDLRCKCTCLSYPKYNISAQATSYYNGSFTLKLTRIPQNVICNADMFLPLPKCLVYALTYWGIPACHFKIYTGGVVSSKCDCLDFIVPALNVTYIKKSDLEPYCLRCECKYEVRSTKTMEVVVCIFIVLIGTLVFYMIFMLAADPIMALIKSKKNLAPERDSQTMMMMQQSNSADQSGGKSVFQRVNSVQSRWKKQVEEQRSNVFDKQDMLQ